MRTGIAIGLFAISIVLVVLAIKYQKDNTNTKPE